jgi:type I restriction enzyme S subunit
MKLSEIATYVTDKILSSNISLEDYVTTDSLLQEKKGRAIATNLPPQDCNLTRFQVGDVLVANIRPYLKKIWLADCDGGCSNDVLVFRAINGHSSKFLYAVLLHDAFYDYAMLGSKGSKMPRGDKDQIMRYETPMQSNEDYIGNFIVNIKNKIETLNTINRNLEAMAKQLYDYWFVQFDFPDENGRPYKSSGGKMVWNEKLKREIPEGWSSIKIRDLADTIRESCTPSLMPDLSYRHFSIPAFDKSGDYDIEKGIDIQSDKFIINERLVLISKLNPWTSRVVWCGNYDNQICSTEYVALQPKREWEKGYLYWCLKSEKLIAYASKGATGTSNSHKRVSPEFLTAFDIPYKSDIVKDYSVLTESIQHQILRNKGEIKALTKQRDELLPLLMNGQVSVTPPAVNCDL